MMRGRVNLALVALLLASCDDEEAALDAACTDHLQLTADANPAATSSGVRVFGAVSAPPGVTVRAVYVAGTKVPRTDFNYRGFQVDLPQALLEAIAENGVATLGVTAFTSLGCDELPEEERPRVEVATEADAGGAADN
ncbi:MAG TPA: hypothetical protein VJU61_13225 [Polyangiaceae bacterium]|nr:hypothetical protein [Polyangiaceae bacterium]